jgi:hypothetical protein
MDLKTVAWNGVPAEGDRHLHDVREPGWRAFLGSFRWGAVLLVACVFGLVAIFSANPLASASVSERVSDKLGQPSSCTEVGAAQIAGVNSSIYRCTVGRESHTPCFVISGREVKQFSGSRELGC